MTLLLSGDVNGDGIDDVLMGTMTCYSYPFSAYCFTYGLAYLVLGKEQGDAPETIQLPVGTAGGMDPKVGAQFISPVFGTAFGCCVGGAADFNGDGE